MTEQFATAPVNEDNMNKKNPMQGVAYINSGLILVILVFL